MKPAIVAPLVALALAAGGAGAYLWLSSGGEEEVVRQPAAETPTPIPEPAPTATATPTPEPSPGVPADWLAYSDPGDLFTVRYPPDWFERDGELYSENPDIWSGAPSLPPEVTNVEIGSYPDDGLSGCGVLSADTKTGEVSPAADATQATLGGEPAWQIVREAGDPAIEGGLTRIQGISLIYKGYCFHIAAYFTQQKPDVDAFLGIASTFKFEF